MRLPGTCPLCDVEHPNVGLHIHETHRAALLDLGGVDLRELWALSDGTPNFINSQFKLDAYFECLTTPAACRCSNFPLRCWNGADAGNMACCSCRSPSTIAVTVPGGIPPIPPAVPIGEIKFKALVGPNIYALWKHSPDDPTLRGLILKRTSKPNIPGCWVPDGADILKTVVEWASTPPPAPPAPPPVRTYGFIASYRQSQGGTCSYTETGIYRGTLNLNEDEMFDIASECESFEEFESAIRDAVVEDCDCSDQDSSDDISYDSYERNYDADGGREDFKVENLTSMAERFLNDHPDIDMRLNGEDEPPVQATPVTVPEEEEIEEEDEDYHPEAEQDVF